MDVLAFDYTHENPGVFGVSYTTPGSDTVHTVSWVEFDFDDGELKYTEIDLLEFSGTRQDANFAVTLARKYGEKGTA